MKIIFYGGRQAGVICLLTLLARGDKVLCVIPQDEIVESIAKEQNLSIFKPESINSKESEEHLGSLAADLLICVHGRQIVKNNILQIPKKGCVNVHPCLSKYKGADPVKRMLEDGEKKASVGVHRMIEKIDAGEVIEEIFVDVEGCNTIIEIYNVLYPIYSIALKRAMEELEK